MGVDDVMALRLPSTSEVRMTMYCEGNGPEVGSPMPTIPLVGLGPDAHASWGPSARATLLATGMVTLTMPGDGMRMPLASRPTSDAWYWAPGVRPDTEHPSGVVQLILLTDVPLPGGTLSNCRVNLEGCGPAAGSCNATMTSVGLTGVMALIASWEAITKVPATLGVRRPSGYTPHTEIM